MALWVTGAIVFAVVVWAYVMRRQSVSTANEEDFESPYYMNYNYPLVSWNPGAQNPVGTASGLPGIPAANADDNGCGCGGGTNGFYTSLQSMLNAFETGAGSAFDDYVNNIKGAFPSYVDQYFNNPVGASQSATATQTFV